MSDAWPFAVLIVGALVTYFWRALGVALSGRVDPRGSVIEWVGCVAYALLAGLIARMIVLPIGPLQETPLAVRLASAGIALAIFFVSRRNILIGVIAGTASLIGLTAGGLPS